MEFDIDSEFIEIIVKDDKNKLNTDELNSFKINSPPNQGNLIESPNNNFTRYEILVKLEDVYFIDNIKILCESSDINIKKIKFQNIINNIWENASFYNTDIDEILIKKNE